MIRLHQRLTQIKLLFTYSLVKDEYSQRCRKSPEFTICSCMTLTYLYQQERVIPSISMAWKNLYWTKILRRLKNEYFAYHRLKQFSFGNFRKVDAVKFHHPFRNLRHSQKLLERPTQLRMFQAIPDLFPLKDFPSQQVQTQGSVCPFWAQIVARLMSGRDKGKKDLEISQWKI